jgi:hypothetical protein
MKLVEGDGANLVMDGTAPGLVRLIPAQTERGVESVRCQQAHYASCVVPMAWISTS